MYDIRQFRPMLYLVLVLGISGFALAAESPALWALGVGATLLHAWLVRHDRFRPLPRWLANLVALSLVALVALRWRGGEPGILALGQGLVLLSVVLLYQARVNKDYSWLLSVSLLLMVAASISTASLWFGVLLVLYLFVALYACLLFHLKVETDHAKQQLGITEENAHPSTLRQDQRFLSRSMRRLTGLISAFAVSMAVIVFLIFPRGRGAGLFGPVGPPPGQALTGFSEQVSFQNIARITQNDQLVAYVRVRVDGRPIEGTLPLLLRGVTLDVYNGSDTSSGPVWSWARSPRATDVVLDIPAGETLIDETYVSGPLVTQEITLLPTGTSTLFAIGGPVELQQGLSGRVRYFPRDETLQALEPLNERFRYEIASRPYLREFPAPSLLLPRGAQDRVEAWFPRRRARLQSMIDPRIEEYARRPEVSGMDDAGALAARRPPRDRAHALDPVIARHIEQHLRSAFAYTLDLTDARHLVGSDDPLVAFLYTLRRGHCEYFAGAMTLLCQSLGMQARMVVGFRVDGADFNRYSGVYEVRQLHAHAWVEVLSPDGRWLSYDPTSGNVLDEQTRSAGLFGSLRKMLGFLEFTWANSIVAYDRDSRANLFLSVSQSLDQSSNAGSQLMARLRAWLAETNIYAFSSRMITALIGLMLAALLAAVGWFAWETWKLRRRAARIGLTGLSAVDQLRLARQLGFYDDLLRLLERRRIRCPAHLTPLEFSRSVSYLPPDAFEAIARLTRIFYRVRYGDSTLSASVRRRLQGVIQRLDASLSAPR